MIDFLKIVLSTNLSFPNPAGDKCQIFGLDFDPIFKRGTIIRYVAKYRNLYFTLRGEELTIHNSLTKFFFQNNYMNLTWSQLHLAIQEIESTLGIGIRNARVVRFEFGVVIQDNNIPRTIERLGHYKGKPPLPMHVRGNVYGTFWELSTHKLKIYDKTDEIKRREGIQLDQSLLRVEKCYHRSHLKSLACLRHRPINTLADLIDWQTMQILSEDLVASLNRIEIAPLPKDLERMSPMNLRRWCYLQDHFMREKMKKHHRKVFEMDRKYVNEIIQQNREDRQFMMIQKVREELEDCLAN